jgi:signal transduction histidine kinase
MWIRSGMARPLTIRRSVSRVALVTTFVALLVNAATLIALDIHEYRSSQLADVRTQAEMLARTSAAAVAFGDQREATNVLDLLQQNPGIYAAAIYGPDGSIFASYAQSRERPPPPVAGEAGLSFGRDRIAGFYTVREGKGEPTTVYLRAYYGLYDRVTRYLGILTLVMVGALGIAFVLSNALQSAVTKPILQVTDAARRVVERHDYSVRADPQAGYETGLLAEAFNQMLAEIDRRQGEVLREMREREQAEDALREADRKKDRFLATLAHELRNPLAPILTGVQVLKRKGVNDPDQAWSHDMIDRQVRHMARLLDDLLDVGRITNEKLELRRQRILLATVVEAAMETSRALIERSRHEIRIALPQEEIYLDADPIRLAQIFSNLLNNAAKYTNPGGRIALAAEREDDWIEVAVEDNGIGIAREDLPRVFDIFAQSGDGRDHSQGGLGIGLFLVKTLTEMHGGRVRAESAGAGKGSRFTVRLPVASVVGNAAAARSASPVGSTARRILVADDNHDAAESLATMLRISGNEVRIARDGAEAVVSAEAFRPDAALIDIGMPKLDGYEVAKNIRAAPWGRNMLLVAVTGWGKEEDRRKAFDVGFDHHLTKPASVEDIETILSRTSG